MSSPLARCIAQFRATSQAKPLTYCGVVSLALRLLERGLDEAEAQRLVDYANEVF